MLHKKYLPIIITTMKNLFTAKTAILILLFSGIILICSAFFIEHVLDAKPCVMCWWQRYAHWAITLFTLFGTLTKKYILALYGTLLASITGFTIAIWQTLVQQKILPTPGCGSTGDILPINSNDLLTSLNTATYTLPSCDKIDFTILGFSLANWNIIVMLIFIVVSSLAICYNRCK